VDLAAHAAEDAGQHLAGEDAMQQYCGFCGEGWDGDKDPFCPACRAVIEDRPNEPGEGIAYWVVPTNKPKLGFRSDEEPITSP